MGEKKRRERERKRQIERQTDRDGQAEAEKEGGREGGREVYNEGVGGWRGWRGRAHNTTQHNAPPKAINLHGMR